MEEGNFAVIVDAKSEYTKQLINILKGGMYQGIKKLFTECKEKCLESGNLTGVLTGFQSKLEEVPKWNQEVILEECERLLTESKCDWLEDLITAVFVSHTRVLTSINFSKNKKQINLKIPKTDHFIHQCYIDIARIFYKVPYLMDDTTGRYEYQRNRNEAENLIEKSIETTIRKQLPVKHILQEYLGNDYLANNEQETLTNKEVKDEPTPKLSDLSMDIKELVKTEIENTVKSKEEPNLVNPADLTDIEMLPDDVLKLTEDDSLQIVEEATPETSKELQESVSKVKVEETFTPPVEEPILEKPVEEPILEKPVENDIPDVPPPNYSLDELGLSEDEQEDFGDLDLELDTNVSTEVDLDSNSNSGIISKLEEDDVKSLNLAETHNVLPSSGIELGNEEVKTILLDTKNSLTDEDIEKKRNLKNKKAFNFFSDTIEEETD